MITHIVCDMGGVLVQLEWQQRMEKLLGRSISSDEVHKIWRTARSTHGFETGTMDFDEFAVAFIEDFNLNLSPEAVQAEFLAMVQEPMPECDRVLAELKTRYHLSLLSNTNPAHIGKLRRHGFFDYFEVLFLSYEIGQMKPNPVIFQHILNTLGVAPAQIAFFDDGRSNVEAAQASGIMAFQVTSPEGIRAAIAELEAS